MLGEERRGKLAKTGLPLLFFFDFFSYALDERELKERADQGKAPEETEGDREEVAVNRRTRKNKREGGEKRKLAGQIKAPLHHRSPSLPILVPLPVHTRGGREGDRSIKKARLSPKQVDKAKELHDHSQHGPPQEHQANPLLFTK
jgi:hypothetical protein